MPEEGKSQPVDEPRMGAQALRRLNDELEQRMAALSGAGEAVKAERQRFNELLEMLPAYLILLTPDHRVTFANRFFRERFGECRGQRCFEYLLHRTEPCEVCETYKVLTTMTPLEWEWTGPDGRDYHIYDFPFTDTDGSTLIMEVGLDITERKRAEAALKEANETLEQRVAERTTDLQKANLQLRAQAEELQVQGDELQAQTEELTVANEELRKRERALRESEERFKLAAQNVSDVIWQWNIPTGELSWHGRIDELLGYDSGEFPRTIEAWEEVIHPNDRDRVLAALDGHLKQGRPYREEYRVLRRDGTVAYWLDCGITQRDDAGRPDQMIGSISDITGRKQAEEALRESEHRVRAKLDSILTPEGDIGTLDLADMIDVAGIQALVNDFYRLARVPMSIIDLQGKILVGVGWQTICTKFHRAHAETCRYCIESDTQLSAGLAPGEVKLYRCKNHMWDIATPIFIGGKHVGNVLSGQFLFEGEPVDYERFRAQARRCGFDEAQYIAALEAVPRLTHEAVDTGMAFFTKLAHMLSQLSYSNIQMARLLSEHDRLADSLRGNEDRLKRAQAIAHLGSWELDLGTNELTWSDEVYRIFGLEPQEFGATYGAFLERVHPEDRDAVNAAYLGSLQEGLDTYEIEHRVVRKNTGEIRYVHEKCEHFRDATGTIVRSAGMVHDITERRRAEEALRQANERLREQAEELAATNKDLEQFAYIASHDLQEPLRAVSGFVTLLQQRYRGRLDEKADSYIHAAVEGASRMQALISGLLEYSRVGTRGNAPAPSQAGRALKEAMKNLQTLIQESGAVITSDALPVVSVDVIQLTHLFQNLIANAIKFRSERTPEIQVGSRHEDGSWRFWVRDNGIGIEPQYGQRIFLLFQRLHTRAQYPGTGIGLSICKRIVERHGGRIWVESQPGRGSTFYFTLPDEGERL